MKIETTKRGLPVEHGNPHSYKNHKCTCDECTEAWRQYIAPYVKRSRERKKRAEGNADH